jgi:hypothetical protein
MYNKTQEKNIMFTFENLKSELSALNYPYAVKHRTYGNGQLAIVTVPSNGNSLYVTIDLESGSSRLFALKALLDFNLLEMPEDLKTVLTEAQSVFFDNYQAVETAKREAARLAYEQKKQEEEDKKNEEKYQASKAKMIKEFETLTAREKTMSTTAEFYYGLGWMANNCGTFACALPDYLLSYFQKQFGTDYEPRTVDSRKRTVNGYAMQWTISMTASIKKKSLDKIPAFLTQYLSKTGTAIANTSFIWDLVTNYGFKFGKTQDIDQIRATIPTEYIQYFENGYAE